MSSLLTRRSENSLIGIRIQLLTSQHGSSNGKDCSPTLKDLREKRKNRVKRVSEIYEKTPWFFKDGECNWWLNDFISPVPTPSPKIRGGFEFPTVSITQKIDDEGKLNQLLSIERDQVTTMRNYIRQLEVSVLNGIGFTAMKLRDYKYCVFGDLKAICELHESKIFRQLLIFKTTGGKCIYFVKFLTQLLEDGKFYCYVRHKMMELNMKKCQSETIHTVKQLPIIDTFKMLETYHNWITNVCNELMKCPTKNADDVAACMEAEKKLIKLMETIADAGDVGKITQISEVSVEMQFKVVEIAKRHEEIKSPMLLLIANKHPSYGLRYPINVLRLGKFLRSFEISMTSQDYGYKHTAKFFIFELCVIYSNILENFQPGKTFGYENHFWIKNVTFAKAKSGEFLVQLVNSDHTLIVDNIDFVLLLRKLSMRHKHDEVTAKIKMSISELLKFEINMDDLLDKKWRRFSFADGNTSSFSN